MNPLTDQQLRRQARELGFRAIPIGALDGPWRDSLARFISSHTQNAANDLRYANVQWPMHTINPWSGEFRFSFLAARRMPMVLTNGSFADLQMSLFRMFIAAKDYTVGRVRLRPTDFVQYKLWSGDERHTLSTPMRQLQYNTIRAFIQQISDALNSAEEIDLASSRFVITYARRTAGGAYPLRGSMTLDTWLKQKSQTIALIDSRGTNDCFWQCLAIALDGETTPELLRTRSKKLRVKVGETYRALLADCGFTLAHPTMVSLNEMDFLEQVYEVSIDIYRAYDLRCLRRSTAAYEKKMVMLEVSDYDAHEVHYHSVKPHKIGSLFGRRKFCNLCNKAYQNIRHRCIPKCYGCKRADCEGKDNKLEDFTAQCNQCNRRFYNGNCIVNHQNHCKERMLCAVCNVIYNADGSKPKKHVCFQDKCKNCKKKVDTRTLHRCFMAKPHMDLDKPKEAPELFFYDYECYFNQAQDHLVALVVVMDPANQIHVFETNDAFVDYVMEQSNAVFIAHNAARYDSHFVKRMLLERGIVTHDVVNGCSMMEMRITTLEIRFIDSLKFIPMPLRNFARTFGITHVSKGHFPYRFFTEENLHYKGKMPDVSWFEFQKMSTRDRLEAEEWYARHQHDDIDLWEMCKEYCIDDVKLLAAGCRLFQESFMEVTAEQFSPFEKMTIAGVCLRVFKSFFLKADMIGIYNPNMKENPKLRHWKNQLGEHCQFQEERDLGLVIGYSEQGTSVFRRCMDSGCLECYDRFTPHPISFQPMMHVNKRVQAYLEEHHLTQVTRQCKYKEEASTEECEGLDIREALYGGRTEVFWEKCTEGKMGYVDFTSLYPFVLYGKDAHGYLGHDYDYPVGHPTVRNGLLTVEDLNNSFGFAKCQVRAPEGLHIPLLPHRRDGKLMFELGTFTGTWTTVELRKAQTLGYQILKVYCIVHYAEKSSDLFREYIQEFYRKKVEATGWKKLGLVTPEQREYYLKEMETRYDITHLNMKEECNEGMYYISKLCLNSLWGKFAQRERFSQTRDVFTEAECFELLEDDTIEVNNVFLYNRDARSITYTKKKGFEKPGDTNVAIAAYTTAYGRLCLYSLLETVGDDRVLYCDTDSVVFRKTPGLPVLPIGSFLGQLTDELNGDDIVQFVATGPKSYAYITAKGKETIKIKGFTLTANTRERLGFTRMLELAEGDEHQYEMVPELRFTIHKEHKISTKRGAEKKFRRTQNKRRRVTMDGNIRSEPHVFHS